MAGFDPHLLIIMMVSSTLSVLGAGVMVIAFLVRLLTFFCQRFHCLMKFWPFLHSLSSVIVCLILCLILCLMLFLSVVLRYTPPPQAQPRRLFQSVDPLTATPEQKIASLAGGFLRQLLFLSVTSTGQGILGVLSWWIQHPGRHVDASRLCSAQALLSAYLDLASAYWCAALSYDLYRFICKLGKELEGSMVRRRYWVYHIVAWGLPVVHVVLATHFSTNSTNNKNTGVFCGLEDPSGEYGVVMLLWCTYHTALLGPCC